MSTSIRPNGKVYRPRKGLRVTQWGDGDYDHGVIVLGTHDIEAARTSARRMLVDYDCDLAGARVRQCWLRDGYERGERAWVEDSEHGAAAVTFTCECC